MYEYKVDIYKVKYAEEAMNTLAKDRWRVIAISPDHHTGFIDVFYEREKIEDAEEENTGSVAVTKEEVLADRAVFTDEEDPSEKDDDSQDDDVNYAVREDIWEFDGENEEESGDNE